MVDMIALKAFRGPSGVFLVWWHHEKVADCLGYAILRRVNSGEAEALLGYVSFADPGKPVQANVAGEPSTQWPYQRFSWTDFNPPAAGRVEYRAVAVAGSPDAPHQTGLVSDWIEPRTPDFGRYVPYFNFGIVGSRWFSKMAEAYPNEFAALRTALAPQSHAGGGHAKSGPHKKADTHAAAPHKKTNEAKSAPGDASAADKALANILALPIKAEDGAVPPKNWQGKPATIGDMLGGELAAQMHSMMEQAIQDEKTEIYAALFELSEPALIGYLQQMGQRCHLVLANGTHQNGSDENAAAAKQLGGKVDLHRRMLKTASVYAHNKFVVFVENGEPQRVWTGSTNWSPHGVYTQVNNGLMVDDADLATAYLAEWKRLRDAENVTPPPPAAGAQEQYHFEEAGQTVSAFFSPHHLPKSQGAKSPDIQYASALIRAARQGVLTLMLDPGWTDSLLQTVRQVSEANRNLYVRGVVNTDPTVHVRADATDTVGFLHGHEAIPSNYDIVLPSSQHQGGDPIYDYLGRVGIVVVHSKVIVIDPLGDHPVVMTGSHNMGVKAATINDDNLIIIENNRDLAIAYAINVISTFNHFWWRHNMAPPSKRQAVRTEHHKAREANPTLPRLTTQQPASEWKGLQTTDIWQDKFYRDASEASEVRFWGIAQ
jgi:phosphatidylserine/phosphatidylglycerophosphate/cardiolipin synthase-like enzyme